MKNEPRNESLPRVSDIIKFIDEEEFNKIHRITLNEAAKKGTRGHDTLEKYYNSDVNTDQLVQLRDAIRMLNPKGKPTFEHQLNGSTFTGRPDMYYDDLLNDFKFGILMEKVALQLAGYDILLKEKDGINRRRWTVSHFQGDKGMFLYEVPEAAHADLRLLFLYCIYSHESIDNCGIERYHALSKWDELTTQYQLLVPLNTFLPELKITNKLEAQNAMHIYHDLVRVEQYKDYLKSQITRYMVENECNSIDDGCGKGIILKKGRNMTKWDVPEEIKKKWKQEKDKYIVGKYTTNPSIQIFTPD